MPTNVAPHDIASSRWRVPFAGRLLIALAILTSQLVLTPGPSARAEGTLEGTIVDQDSGAILPARIYVSNAAGEFFHVTARQPGQAIPYSVRRSAASLEIHTTVSATRFQAALPAGEYQLVAEHGKEYYPATHRFSVRDGAVAELRIPLRRWINMPQRGWYSGETHSHRSVRETPTLQLAEDLHVSFPLTAWVTDTQQSPAAASKVRDPLPAAELVEIDETHVFWPINTEYELFTVRGQAHTLGAFFVLNHRTPLQLSAPPVSPIAELARQQGAFLELDKHNWPWSMMIVPRMKVDLFELTNNHVWRTEFLFKDWYPAYVAEFMQVDMRDGGFTERGWLEFGFRTYYALLNCGLRMKPTAGTASGVHPVPLGFGRVYVQLGDRFGYDSWCQGLLAGHSFVTTGPMLMTEVARLDDHHVRITGSLESDSLPTLLEVIINGSVAQSLSPEITRTPTGACHVPVDLTVPCEGSVWVAVRAWSTATEGRQRFAHSAPVHLPLNDQPVRPTRAERDYLVKRVADELERNRDFLPAEALAEYQQSLEFYRALPAR